MLPTWFFVSPQPLAQPDLATSTLPPTHVTFAIPLLLTLLPLVMRLSSFPAMISTPFRSITPLITSDINFVTYLLSYIIPAGIQILDAEQSSVLPNQDWLPAPPNLSSFSTSSSPSLLFGGSCRPSSCHSNNPHRQPPFGSCLNPEGFDSSFTRASPSSSCPSDVPSFIMGGSMGGSREFHGISPITHNCYGGAYSNYKGGCDSFSVGGRSVAPTPPLFEVQLIASSSMINPFPLAHHQCSSGSSTLVVSVLEDYLANPKINATHALIIKDGPSDCGLKDITNKTHGLRQGRSLMLVSAACLTVRVQP
jgi:hypothetical protein